MTADTLQPGILRMRRLVRTLAVIGLLAGCASNPNPSFPDEADLEEAWNDLEESKRDYELCLRDQDEDVDIDCEVFKEIYEEDQGTYDNLFKLKRARR